MTTEKRFRSTTVARARTHTIMRDDTQRMDNSAYIERERLGERVDTNYTSGGGRNKTVDSARDEGE